MCCWSLLLVVVFGVWRSLSVVVVWCLLFCGVARSLQIWLFVVCWVFVVWRVMLFVVGCGLVLLCVG